MIDPNKKYRNVNGYNVRIYATDGAEPMPIHGAFYFKGGWVCSTFNESGLIEVSPYEHINIDDPVYVWDGRNMSKLRMHFAGISENGKARTWAYGRTSFSSVNGEYKEWEHCELAK